MSRNLAGNIGVGGGSEIAVSEAPIDPLIADREAATILGCGRSTIWRWASEGTIPKPIKIGGLSRWRLSWITRVIADAEKDAA